MSGLTQVALGLALDHQFEALAALDGLPHRLLPGVAEQVARPRYVKERVGAQHRRDRLGALRQDSASANFLAEGSASLSLRHE